MDFGERIKGVYKGMGHSKYLDSITLDYLLKSQWFDEDNIYKRQLEGLQDLLRFAKKHTKFYKDYPIVKDLESLDQLPMIDKTVVTENLPIMNARHIVESHEKWTGGTTKQIVLYFPNFQQIIYTIDRFTSWYPKGTETGRKVVIWGWGELAGLQNITKPTFRGLNQLYLPIQGMSNRKTISSYLRLIQKYNPAKIRGYASSLIALAHEQLEKQYKFPDLKAIVNNCEPIIPQTRKLIEDAFGITLFDFYGSQDLGGMAQSCEERNGLHLNSDRYILQVGEYGQFIWTDLFNYATIMIRYKNDDQGVLSDKKCKCGRGLPLIDGITGRTLYWLWLKNDGWLNSTEINEYMYYFVPNHLYWCMEHQVIQEEKGKARLLIHPWNKSKVPDYNGLIKHFAELELDVSVEIVDKVQRSGPTAKQLACITKFKPPWEMR